MDKYLIIPANGVEKLKSMEFPKPHKLEPVKGVVDGVEIYILQADLKQNPVFANALADFEASEEIIIYDLPEVGQPVTMGLYYKYDHYIIKCIQSHSLTAFAPIEVPNLFSFFRQEAKDLGWIPNEWVELGFERIHNTVKYRCIQAHQTVVGLTPDITPALWTKVPVGILPWVQPQGAHDAYRLDAQVTYGGFTWKNISDYNVYAPGVYGWVKL